MQELISALKNADDDYLVGLSNKGIVKRAYKDLEQLELSIEYEEYAAKVTVSEETCTIVSPLGDSNCTCPSRSICRHIIAAILWLKKSEIGSLVEKDTSEPVGKEIPIVEVSKEPVGKEIPIVKVSKELVGKEISVMGVFPKERLDIEGSKTGSSQTEFGQEKKELSPELVKELTNFPFQKIQKAMKKRYYTSFMKNAEQGIFPEIQETSILSVKFPNEEINVRLIFPIAHSTCTCHSKELCKHKAAAILTWQLKHKIVSLDSVKINEENVNLNIPKIQKTAKIIENFLHDIFSNGLVRISDDAAERAEDMAVICHNAHLANSEKLMREMGNQLSEYVRHSPKFRTNELFESLMKNIILTNQILKANNEKDIYSYAGEFRDAYIASGSIALLPIAQRKFSSMTGYEGDVYYFLNKNAKEHPFLSYSNIRPTFYEGRRKSVPTQSAPWGLDITVNDMMGSEIHLKNPKLSDGKISTSKDTKGEVIGKVDLNQEIVYQNIYTNFEKMVKEIFQRTGDGETERMVLVFAKKCISSKSDEITQSHSIVIEDGFSHRLTIRAGYKSENKEFFSQLKYIGDRMQKHTEKKYVIFANAYIEKGTCYLFPIAIFDHIEVPQLIEENENHHAESTGKEAGSYFSSLFHEIQQVLCEILQCGINSFELYETLNEYAMECQRSGLLLLGDKLKQLCELLKAKKHTCYNDNREMIEVFLEIYQYLSIGVEKTKLQQAIYHLYNEG